MRQRLGVVAHLLATAPGAQRATLEDVYLALTRDEVEFRAVHPARAR
ncbi:hypothetical protein Franean1_4806 [Parafrankia sp. EAN1pec]|nr:hypothetical protein Franean1_4806 [Frankia sp. EAN1pec]